MKIIQILTTLVGLCQANDIVGIDMGNFNTKIAYKVPNTEDNGFVVVPSFVSFDGPD